MRKTILALVIGLSLLSGSALAESKTPYDPILKASLIKKQIEIDGEMHVRVYLKPTNPDTDIDKVELWIERNGNVLKTMKPALRSITEESLSPDYPWEVYLPVGKRYANGAELFHNLEPGGLGMSFSAHIKGKGTKIKSIDND